jgi:CRP/FNR family transcriptional regulator
MSLTQSKKRELLDTFFRTHTRLQFKKGETIIRPEDEPTGVFLIEWGFVKAFNITKYGEKNLLSIRGTGSVFPLIWAFTGEHRQITYQAMEPTSLWRVSKTDYRDFLDRNPDIMPVILDMAIEAYRLHSERVMTLSYRTTRERIMSFLVANSKRFGILNKDGSMTIHVPFRQIDIANSVNATRETTSRELNGLKRKGIISMTDHKIVVHDLDALKAEL